MADVRIAVHGATGRMGRRVLALAHTNDQLRVVAATSRDGAAHDTGLLAGLPASGLSTTGLGAGCFADAQVIIDFSTPQGLHDALPHIQVPLVTGTTGLTPEQIARLVQHSARAAILAASNFSTGVALLADLVERAARALPDYDVEIVEAHHRHKSDAPSGTALTLAHAAARGHASDLDEQVVYGRHGLPGARPAGQIGIHAVRMGDVIGDHTVWLAGEGERLHLGHVATSRDTFAHGALRAAAWLHDKGPGRYELREVLGLA